MRPRFSPPDLRHNYLHAAGFAELALTDGRRKLASHMGSPAIASLIAHLAFWVLAVYGWFWDELGPQGLSVFLALWLVGMFGLPLIPYGASLFSSFVAVLDIALVFTIFKGDVRL